MAPKKTSKKTTGTQKRKYNKQKQNNIKENGAIQDDIILVIALAVSILLFLSNFNLCGAVGNILSSFAFGMIGAEAYILPFIIFFMTAFHLSNVGNKRAGRKIMSAFVFFIALAALIELITNSYSSSTMIFDYYTYSKNGKNGGGIIGGILVMILYNLFAKTGTYIILIAMMLISIILISGKALISLIAKKGKSSYQERKEYQRLRREQQAEIDADAVSNAQDSKRRPPKTYVLDSTTVASKDKQKNVSLFNEEKAVSENKAKQLEAKDKKQKKNSDSEGDSFMQSFHSLFEKDTTGSVQTEGIPLYEQELRMKFGNSELDEQGQDNIVQDSIFSTNDIAYTAEIIDSQQEENYQSEIEAPASIETTASESKEAEHGNASHSKEQNSSLPKTDAGTTSVEELGITQLPQKKEYIFPPIHLLSAPKQKSNKAGGMERDLKDTALKLQSTLESFGVHVTITNVSCGPAVTRYELQPEQGVKVSRITALADDIKLNLAAADIRIEAPIPGKAAVGIEVPNKENSMVAFRELIESKEFKAHPSDIAFAVGKDIGGQTIITDIAKMPHLLIAGATGSGKSVCINTLIMSILYKAKPSDVRLIMVDPKVVELNVYNGIPHLLIPVVTDPKKASAALNWAVMEMTERYKKFAEAGVRDLKGYNEKVAEVEHLQDESCQKLPQIVIIIDELADLMMVAPGEVEDAICRLAQMARAAGLHLIIATQRPSVNVITGLIKANIPSRIAFAVSSAIDSRTILDGSGAEKLLGKGDMLFFPSGYPKPVRIQGAFVSDKEVSSVVEFLKKNNSEVSYSDDIHDKINNAKLSDNLAAAGGEDRDEYFAEAGKFIIEKDKASIGMLQRVYKIGFNRAARIMDQLAEAGVVGPEEGTKPRKILMTQEQFEQYLEEH
jgi:S-DNA-T family DNA segregation ATPase FtsK/SpoIIIE